jgi:hypothetical protein
MKRLLALAFGFIVTLSCLADSVESPYRKATTSESGLAIFVMMPVYQDDAVKRGDGRGIMYALKSDGSFEKKWETSGWYSHGVIPSDDAEFLVRIGDWPEGDGPKKEDLAVAFYRRGKVVRSYSTADLVIDTKKVRRTVSHYYWLAEGKRSYIHDTTFVLTTVDDRCIVFDLTSGMIARVYEPKSVSSNE